MQAAQNSVNITESSGGLQNHSHVRMGTADQNDQPAGSGHHQTLFNSSQLPGAVDSRINFAGLTGVNDFVGIAHTP